MNDSSEYIEAYFKEQLNDAEKRQFEERCVHDELFAREVALFITTTEGIRQNLLSQKKQQWTANESYKESAKIRPLKKLILNKWMTYAAAACLLLALIIYFLYSPETPHQRASQYIAEHFTLLSQTMSGSNDSMQQGITAYNNKDYNTALQVFSGIYRSHPQNFIAKKYIGFVYLATQNYDKALQQFDELANTEGLYKNPGLFLKALTLLQRNKHGDEAQAKQLLKEIVKEKGEGSREAEKWLKTW
jgi:TolA-binding protein